VRGGAKDCSRRKAWGVVCAPLLVLAVTALAGAQKPAVTLEQPSQVENVAGTVVSVDTATRTLVLQPAKTQGPITLTWEKDKDAFMQTVTNNLKRGTGVRVQYKKAGGKVQDISIVKVVDRPSP
jgi:hypothetical protein